MAATVQKEVLIGVIGGSGLYHLNNLTAVRKLEIETPWGNPSSPITIMELPSGAQVAFLARHGIGHTIQPSKVPARANIAALKSLGVKAILAFSAVGSLREEIAPGDFVIPSQIIDRTKGVRPVSFFEDTSVVAHAAFGDPFGLKYIKFLEGVIRRSLEGRSVNLHTDKCVVCMEGPQFSTRAESRMYRAWGGDIINMSVLPEAKLAREAELSYALVATATDYDAWRIDETPVTTAEVVKTLMANAELSRHVTATVIDEVQTAVVKGDILEEVSAMKTSIFSQPDNQAPTDRQNLAFILPEYFS